MRTTSPDLRTLFAEIVASMFPAPGPRTTRLIDHLIDTRGRAEYTPVIHDQLESVLDDVWNDGWQPAVIHAHVCRELDASAGKVLVSVMGRHALRYRSLGEQVAPHWMDQLAELGADGVSDLHQLGLPPDELIRSAAALSTFLLGLGRLPPLMPPPSQWHAGMAVERPTEASTEMLLKIRALLAKAESTDFDAEAEAFTAKAQELMTRHRIDQASLANADRAGGDTPEGRYLRIDNPYPDTKAVLLSAICRANGGHAIWSKQIGFSTVFAPAAEQAIIDHLYTSLLVQATAALRREGSKTDRYGRSRTKSFRRSFLLAFAARVGDRLLETVDQTVADVEAETGTALVPVLAGRAEEAREAAEAVYTRLRPMTANVSDAEGWHAGTEFGNRADLSAGAGLHGGR